jgi:hypothetical protein
MHWYGPEIPRLTEIVKRGQESQPGRRPPVAFDARLAGAASDHVAAEGRADSFGDVSRYQNRACSRGGDTGTSLLLPSLICPHIGRMPTSNLPTLTAPDHQPILHKLSLLRDPHTGTRDFKQLVTLVSPILRAGRGGDRP